MHRETRGIVPNYDFSREIHINSLLFQPYVESHKCFSQMTRFHSQSATICQMREEEYSSLYKPRPTRAVIAEIRTRVMNSRERSAYAIAITYALSIS